LDKESSPVTFSQVGAATKRAQPFFRYYGAPRNYLDILFAGLPGRARAERSDLPKLETELATFLGTNEALCLPQGRVGLYVALKHYLSPAKRKVILSPYTIYDVVNSVIAAGGIPVFADIDQSTCNIDFDSVAKLIDAETGAVIITHLHGLACEMGDFVELCRDRNIALLEDCAQAFGGTYGGQRLGTIGDAGIFSFSMKKNVNSLYGGCLIVKDPEVRAKCRDFLEAQRDISGFKLLKRALLSLSRDLAYSQPIFDAVTFPLLRRRVNRGSETSVGAVAYQHNPTRRERLPEHYFRKMAPQQAAIISRQLPEVDRHIAIRKAYAREYHELLRGLPGIQLPPLREDGSHIYLSFAVQVPDRLSFQRQLMANNCDVRLQTYINLANSPCYADFHADCHNATAVAKQVLLLPIHTGLGMDEVRRIGKIIRALL
jgi:dTDP-4-amino-4,6-dideoxygalactose transaminase